MSYNLSYNDCPTTEMFIKKIGRMYNSLSNQSDLSFEISYGLVGVWTYCFPSDLYFSMEKPK